MTLWAGSRLFWFINSVRFLFIIICYSIDISGWPCVSLLAVLMEVRVHSLFEEDLSQVVERPLFKLDNSVGNNGAYDQKET